MGAVNTILFNENVLTGYNTDYFGFGASLRKENIEVNKRRTLILGTGGAAKAVAHYLIDNGINDVVFVSRDPKGMKEKLANDSFFIDNTRNKENNINMFKIISYEEICNIKNFDIIINCTPCGMYPNVEYSPVEDKSMLMEFSTAIDLIYNPEETLFLRQAKKMGLKAFNGLYMLVAQAVASQEVWQGIKIEDKLVEEIYEDIRVIMYGKAK
jgi:shikimate dehydrogenase